jgi:TetR/AcrR family acrAB operon transcriptional repressor
MVRKTKEEACATRSQLLDAAERVFNDKGVSRTSLNEIAVAAGLTRGAIYWHFKNKADLFDAMMERVILPMENMVERAGDRSLDDPLAFIRGCAINVLVRTAQDEQLQRVFDIFCHKCEYVGEMVQLRERQLEGRNACLAEVESGIRNAIIKGQLPATVNARRAAIGMHALIDGLIANWVLDPTYFKLEREAEGMIDIYLAGMAAMPPAPSPPARNRRRIAK